MYLQMQPLIRFNLSFFPSSTQKTLFQSYVLTHFASLVHTAVKTVPFSLVWTIFAKTNSLLSISSPGSLQKWLRKRIWHFEDVITSDCSILFICSFICLVGNMFWCCVLNISCLILTLCEVRRVYCNTGLFDWASNGLTGRTWNAK